MVSTEEEAYTQSALKTPGMGDWHPTDNMATASTHSGICISPLILTLGVFWSMNQ